ncbi:hypothetical protein GGR55DRAFT_679036 [Xylaria sp. FL0064]|nr:hypothetical protein GGR55DRAFT_679036 [Xylaria sp. FL0064]
MSASIAYILCFLEAFALRAPVTPFEYPTFVRQNYTGHTTPISPNLMINGTIKATGEDANDNSPPPKDNSNAIIGIVLGSTAGIVLILWCDGGGVFNNRVPGLSRGIHDVKLGNTAEARRAYSVEPPLCHSPAWEVYKTILALLTQDEWTI